jgi:hypothetical protein
MAKYTIVSNEKVNIYNLERLLNSVKLKELDDSQDGKNILGALHNYNQLLNVDNEVLVSYEVNKFGRFNNVTKLGYSFSYMNMMRDVRNLLSDKYYIDVDICNCHPKIIENMCAYYNLDHVHLSNYNLHREEKLKELIALNNNITYKLAKEFITSIPYGGSIEKFISDYKIKYLPQWIFDYKTEILTNRNIILEYEDLNDIRAFNRERLKKKQKTWNEEGSTFAIYIQDIERNIITSLYNKIINDGFTVGAIIHDGLHILKDNLITIDILDKWIDLINKEFKFKYPFKLSIKEMDLNISYLTVDSDTNLYLHHKEEFEKTVYRVEAPIGFRIIVNDIERPLGETELRQRYANHKYINEKGTKFIDIWLKDPFMRSYKWTVFNPRYPGNFDDVCNIYKGMYISKYKNNKLPVTQEERIVYCKVLLDYIHNISGGIDKQYNFVINWLANIIQKPYKKTGIALVIKSTKHGVGKNTLYNLMSALIGDEFCDSTAKLHEFFSKHSNFRLNKLLICLNEIKFSDSKAHAAELKDCITEPYFNYEEKFKARLKIYSCENYIILSNSECPVLKEANDRRYFVIDLDNIDFGSNEQKSAYFSKIYNIIGDLDKHIQSNKNILRCFYDYLMNIDISKFKLEVNIDTEAGNNIKAIDIVDEFLENLYFIKSNEFVDNEYKIKQSDLFHEYMHYLTEKNVKTDMNDLTFGRKLNKYSFITKIRTTSSRYSSFNCLLWKTYYKIN